MNVNEVIKIINDHFAGYKPDSEELIIEESVGRIAAADVTAPEDIPGFNRSPVDVYAVISSDTF
jgi:molybdopterin molybdotransferase